MTDNLSGSGLGAPQAFRTQMRDLRLRVHGSVRRAASYAGITGTRWNQIERGYEVKRGHRKATYPTATAVRGIAQSLQWDVREALTLAGFDPDSVEIPEQPADAAVILGLWNGLPPGARDGLVSLLRGVSPPGAVDRDTDAVA